MVRKPSDSVVYENGSVSYGRTTGYYAYAYDRFSLELRYPFLLGNTTIYGLTFVEAGNAWYDTKDFNPFSMKRSAGVGVRIFLPMVGLMGIDWAYGFDKVWNGSQYKKGGSQFHFILGRNSKDGFYEENSIYADDGCSSHLSTCTEICIDRYGVHLEECTAYERANEQLNQVSRKWQAEVEALNTEASTNV